MKKITLKEMLETEVNDILTNYSSGGHTYFYRNGEGEYHEIVELDLFRGRFVTDDGDFSEFEWELEESHIYMDLGEIMTRKDVVAKYSPNDINENNKGGVYGCPYENRYSDFLFVLEKECVCSCEKIDGYIPAEACERCWNTEVNRTRVLKLF